MFPALAVFEYLLASGSGTSIDPTFAGGFISAAQVLVDVTEGSTMNGTAAVVSGPLVSGFGAGRDAFVTTLYLEALGRLPEPSGLRFWSGVLDKGVRPKTVAAAIWKSPEHRSLVRQHLAPGIPFRRSHFDALFAGRQAARLHRSE